MLVVLTERREREREWVIHRWTYYLDDVEENGRFDRGSIVYKYYIGICSSDICLDYERRGLGGVPIQVLFCRDTTPYTHGETKPPLLFQYS